MSITDIMGYDMTFYTWYLWIYCQLLLSLSFTCTQVWKKKNNSHPV